MNRLVEYLQQRNRQSFATLALPVYESFSVEVVFLVSFMLGLKYSEYLARRGQAATSLVMAPPPNELPTANTPLAPKPPTVVVETLPRPSRASEIMRFGYPSYDSLRACGIESH